jgi:dihydropteroate synthase
MGIVNVTPDSFSDGGDFFDPDTAILHGLSLIKEGADIIDIGGESTRPDAEPVSAEQELDRVIPVIKGLLKQSNIPISIDTSKPRVMAAAIQAGASMINDVNGFRADGAVEAAANAKVPICIMHMQGDPQTMQKQLNYNDVVAEVIDFLTERKELCLAAGVEASNIIVDPGIGFGKSLQHNLQLLAAIPRFCADIGQPLLIGVSRKSMIDKLLGRPVEQRLAASLGLAVQAVINGAKIVRVHDVRASYDALQSIEAVSNSNNN